MNQTLQEKTGASVVLKRVKVQSQGLSLRYALLAVEEDGTVRYDGVAELGDEKQTVTLGTNVKRAVRLFEQLWRGAVTPCVLEEMVCDLRTARSLGKKIRKKRLITIK